MNTLREDDVVLCTVKKIEGTTVFVDIENNGQGNIVLSEIAPGRIRNIREFVTEGKKIVCKVLKIQDNRIELSLRRVTAKEREEVLDQNKKEKTLMAIIEPILKEKTQAFLKKIENDYSPAEFLDIARETPEIIEKFVTKQEAEKLTKIFSERREKEKEVKKTVTIKSQAESGLSDIKKVLATDKADVSYLGSSKFLVRVKDKDFKKANLKLVAVIKEMEDKAKTLKMYFEAK